MDSTKPILGYWEFRGRAQSIRLLLTYVGEDFVDKRYSFENKSEWQNDKLELGFDFPNLPYLIDGEHKLTQSVAIMRYLGRKYNLDGKTESERIAIDLIENVVLDFLIQVGALIYGAKMDEDQKTNIANKHIKPQLEQISAFFGKDNRDFVAGSSVTYVDFYLYEQLVRVSRFAPEIWEKYENLVQYFERMEQLPRVKEYVEGREAVPLFSPNAKRWNSSY